MQTYIILRRGGWATAQDLEAAATRSSAEGEQMPEDIRHELARARSSGAG